MGLFEEIDSRTAEGALCVAENGAVRCTACAHRCLLEEGARGVCRMRFNRGGKLMVPYGYVSAFSCDPVEKKPFFHVLPGSGALSFGMPGCNFSCSFCQNYDSSQLMRERTGACDIMDVTPDEITASALRCGARLVVSTYNEPTISAEWAAAVFAKAADKGLLCAFVSNGYATKETVDFLRPYIRAFKVDLKCFDDNNYRRVMGGSLKPVLETIERLHSYGIWVEIVTLVIPGFNDSDGELQKLAGFIHGVSPDIPWHVTAFHPDYKMTDRSATTADTICRAAAIGRAAGLRFVYGGNVIASALEDTLCPSCGHVVVARKGFKVCENRLASGACPDCGKAVCGIWK